MRMYDVIAAKRNGYALTDQQISFVVSGFTNGEIPDYQMSALLMAIYFRGMNHHETSHLTDCMSRSGEVADLSAIPGIKVDKHSTGGVGDKTSLIVCPIVAACGVPVAKMSGRGLGHTGGTIDKLESIPGFQTSITKDRFFDIVNEIGLSIIGQTGSIAPADKKLYALRDVTATVENISLIASSIMSKKIASGCNAIMLDVKTGSGAFMKTLQESTELARTMVSIGESLGRRTVALVTDMDTPLGNAIGNSIEIVEAIETLRGRGPEDLTQLSRALAANMLYLAKKGDLDECYKMVEDVLSNGKALNKFKAMSMAQGGDISVLENTERFARAPVVREVRAPISGYIGHMDTEKCGVASALLGAGRVKIGDKIDHSAGIILREKTGDYIATGQVVAELLTSDIHMTEEAEKIFLEAINIVDAEPQGRELIKERIEIIQS